MCGAAVQSDDKECPRFPRLILRDHPFGSHSKSLHLRRGSAGYRAVSFHGGAFNLMLLVYSIDCSDGRCSLSRSWLASSGALFLTLTRLYAHFSCPHFS
jgi:hypothetical protein